jgi:pimeloyl-ACP methyl ester carboxylesterase
MISGLGGTGVVFQNLVLPERFELMPIQWIEHRHAESLQDYSRRLVAQVDTARPFMLLGYSFGGAIAVEMAKVCSPMLTVIVSGVKSKKELPFYLAPGELFGAHALSIFVHRMWNPILRLGSRIAFSTKDPEALGLLTNMIREADPIFYQWGLRAMMDWDNSDVPENILSIHGRGDRVLPLRYVKADVVIEDAGHFIIFSHGQQIGKIVAEHALMLF